MAVSDQTYHSSYASASSTSTVSPPAAEVAVINALEGQIRTINRKLEDDGKKRKELLRQFNVFRKCLQILLDEKLCRMTILKDSIIGDLTNDYAHTKDEVDTDSLSDPIQEFFETANRPDSKERLETYQTLVDRLSSDSFLGDAYYDNGETTIEKLVDDFMVRHAPQAQDSNVRNHNRDYLVLLVQMEELEPVSQSQQDQRA